MPYAALTQQAEYFLGKEEVVGSSPTGGSGRVLYGAVLWSCSPMAEAAASSTAQCRFESDQDYLNLSLDACKEESRRGSHDPL